jgi:hypothetical protein
MNDRWSGKVPPTHPGTTVEPWDTNLMGKAIYDPETEDLYTWRSMEEDDAHHFHIEEALGNTDWNINGTEKSHYIIKPGGGLFGFRGDVPPSDVAALYPAFHAPEDQSDDWNF